MSTDATSECRCLICQDYGDRDRLDVIDTKLVSDIGRVGWGVLMIPGDDTSAGWAFTVGLWHSYRAPELAMFGLDTTDMMRCLNTVGQRVASGRPVTDGEASDEVLNDYLVTFRAIDTGWYKAFFGTALGFYRATNPVPFLQVLWPDRDGRFPGDQDFAAQLEVLQPRLWLSPSVHPQGPWTDQL